MNVKKISYMAIGSISLALGALGAVLPLLRRANHAAAKSTSEKVLFG